MDPSETGAGDAAKLAISENSKEQEYGDECSQCLIYREVQTYLGHKLGCCDLCMAIGDLSAPHNLLKVLMRSRGDEAS